MGMIQPVARIARTRAITIAAALLLGVGAVAALPAVPASAAAEPVVWTIDQSGTTVTGWTNVTCSAVNFSFPTTDYAYQVYNPCSGRIWLHAYSGGVTYSYCINPGGGFAYGFGRDYTNIQVTTVTTSCEPDGHFRIDWGDSQTPGVIDATQDPTCDPGQLVTITTYYVIHVEDETDDVSNVNASWIQCDTRLWLHQSDSGTGNPSLCVDPGTQTSYYWGPPAVYWEVSTTLNQAACSAGNPPEPLMSY